MRLILACLALANIRWAQADMVRAMRLEDEADAAFVRADARMAVAQRLADRVLRLA